MDNKPSAAGMKLLAALTGRDESFWRPTQRALLSRAMQDFRPMPEGDRVTRQSVHNRILDHSNKFGIWDDSRVSRLTGHSQIDDMVRSGQVRPPELAQKTRKDKVYWSIGAAKSGAEAQAYGQRGIILEASSKIKDLSRPLALDEVTVKAQTKRGVWQDITDQVRSAHQAYKKQLANVPQRAANAARGDAAFAGPSAARAMADDAFTYGMMGGTLGAIPSGFLNNAVYRPTPTP
jgi:hypothetical protein